MKKKTIVLLILSLLNILAFIFVKPLFIEFFALTLFWKALFVLFLYGISIWSIIPCAIIAIPFAYLFKRTHTFKSKWFKYTQVLSLIVGSIILLQNSVLLYSKYVLDNDQFKFIKYTDVKGYDGNTDDLKIGTFSTEYVVIKRYKDHQIELYPNKDSVTYGIKWVSKNEYQLINNVHITGMPDTLDIKISNNTEEFYDCYARYGEYATPHHIKKSKTIK